MGHNFSSKEQTSFNFMAAITICNDFGGPPPNKVCHCFHCFPIYLPWSGIPWRWEYQTTWPASWEICMQVKKQQLDLDMEQQTGSKSGKEYVKAVYCHPTY